MEMSEGLNVCISAEKKPKTGETKEVMFIQASFHAADCCIEEPLQA